MLPDSDKSLMIELWTECNNQCKFCYLGKSNRKTSKFRKYYNLIKTKRIVKKFFESKTERYKAFGIIGGEFFQGQLCTPRIRNEFFALCKQIFQLIEEDKIRDFWCYCTLTVGDQADLYELVELFDQMVTDKEKHKFWVLVSFDTYGRFHCEKSKLNWEKHMLNLQKYPFIKFNVTSILSQDFCEKVLSGEHDLIEFQKKFKCTYFFKQPCCTRSITTKKAMMEYLPNWFVKHTTYIQFLRKLKLESKELFNEILNIELRADDIMQSLNNFKQVHRDKKTWEESHGKINPACGHLATYQCYADSDACCLCDYFKIKNMEEA